MLANLTVTGPRYGPSAPAPCWRPSGRPPRRAAADARAGREDLEREMVRDVLGCHRSVARAAGELGVTRHDLSKLMTRLQIDRFNPGRDHSAPASSR